MCYLKALGYVSNDRWGVAVLMADGGKAVCQYSDVLTGMLRPRLGMNFYLEKRGINLLPQ